MDPPTRNIDFNRRRRHAVTSLTFDDGSRDHRAVAELLADRGMTATFYVNSNLVGSVPDLLDWDDVTAIAELGHEIGGHTSDHLDLTTLAPDEGYAQIAGDRAMLIARGHRADSFAYPFGAIDARVERLVEEAGYAAARRAWGLTAESSPHDRDAVESLPPRQRYAIRTIPSIENGASLDVLKRCVTRAARRGGWLPLVFHRISVGSSTYEFAPSIFERFIDWLRDEQRRVSVETVARVLES